MTLCDASPLIALINQGDDNYQRCVDILPLNPALLTLIFGCSALLSTLVKLMLSPNNIHSFFKFKETCTLQLLDR